GCQVAVEVPGARRRTGGVWGRPERSNPGRHWIDAVGGNPIAGKWITDESAWTIGVGPSGQRVVDHHELSGAVEGLGEITLQLRGCGNSEDLRQTPIFTQAFVAHEPETFIPAVINTRNLKWTAERASELIQGAQRPRRSGAVAEPVVRAQVLIAKKFVAGSAHLAGPRLGDDVHHSTARASELRRERVRLYLELLNRVDNRNIGRGIEKRRVGRHAIDERLVCQDLAAACGEEALVVSIGA